MSIAVVSYSLTGNNGALAVVVATELSAVLNKISEEKRPGNQFMNFIFQKA